MVTHSPSPPPAPAAPATHRYTENSIRNRLKEVAEYIRGANKPDKDGIKKHNFDTGQVCTDIYFAMCSISCWFFSCCIHCFYSPLLTRWCRCCCSLTLAALFDHLSTLLYLFTLRCAVVAVGVGMSSLLPLSLIIRSLSSLCSPFVALSLQWELACPHSCRSL
jgi:hypothetical protein